MPMTMSPMTHNHAIAVIRALIEVEVEQVKAANTGNGRISKKLQQEEDRAVRNLFFNLTGETPSPQQIEEITSY